MDARDSASRGKKQKTTTKRSKHKEAVCGRRMRLLLRMGPQGDSTVWPIDGPAADQVPP